MKPGIDAHQHYWRINRKDYSWLSPENAALYRDFLPEHLEPELIRHGMERTIVIQATQTLAETDFLLQLSERHDTIAGVVGWLDLHDPAWEKRLLKLRQHPKFVGFRVLIQELREPREMLQPLIVEALSRVAERGVPVDLLAKADQLPIVNELIAQVPGLRAVIDHLGKPQIASGKLDPWRKQMSMLAGHPNVYCKLSGMVTEANHANWLHEDFKLYVQHVVHVFGTGRIMFGSDWPVCLTAASYGEVMDILKHSLPDDMTEAELDALYGGNAQAFYRLS